MTASPALRARAAAAAAARAERLAKADPWPTAVREVREVFRAPLTPPSLIADPARRDRVLELLALNEGLHRAGQDERIREGALELAVERLRTENVTLREELDAFRRDLVASIERPTPEVASSRVIASPAPLAPPPEPNPARPLIERRALFAEPPPALAPSAPQPRTVRVGGKATQVSPALLASIRRMATTEPPDPIGAAEERRAMEEESHG